MLIRQVAKLFLTEIKHFYKQSLLFITIAMFLFTLSISVWCFSSDMIDGYKRYLDENIDVVYLTVNDVEDLEMYKEIEVIADYLYASVSGVTYYPTIKFGQSGSRVCLGSAYLFRDNLPFNYKDCVFQGRSWRASDNKIEGDVYTIFLRQSVAEELCVQVGDEITFEYESKLGVKSCNMTVLGIYSNEDNAQDSFVISFNFLLNISNDLLDAVSLHLEIQTPSRTMAIYPKLKSMGLECYSMYIGLDEISLINSMQYILLGASLAVMVTSLFVLNNSLTITVNSRKKYMAKLKLLGATTDKVAAIYYISMLASFIIAYSLGVLLSFYFCGYFSYIAKYVLEYPVSINLHVEACVGLFGTCLFLLVLRYILFRKKIKKIIPLDFIKET